MTLSKVRDKRILFNMNVIVSLTVNFSSLLGYMMMSFDMSKDEYLQHCFYKHFSLWFPIFDDTCATLEVTRFEP